MEEIYKKARAKVNLTLNVLDKRPDGYHNIESVFQKISLYDEIYVVKTKECDGIKININVDNLKEEDNIIFKAYYLLKNKFENIGNVKVMLKKNIPMQAGLGGGSTDCGAFLECMNKLFNLKLSKKDMNDIGKTLGADVPASLYDKPLIGRGIGEKIEEIKSGIKYHILVVKPDFCGNTKKMYDKLDEENAIIQKYNTEKMKKALENSNIYDISNNMYNVFENEVQEIEEIKKEIKNAGAINSLMAGSGSAVFGIFENKEKAKKGYKILKQKYDTFYCLSYIK